MEKNICVTLPSNVDWSDYDKELEQVKDYKMVMNFRVPFLPKKEDRPFIKRCYICHRGFVVGWMDVVGFVDEFDFECQATGKKWNGKFIQRSGPFHPIAPVPMKGFRGFRYVDF
jgi:hypothetical protein